MNASNRPPAAKRPWWLHTVAAAVGIRATWEPRIGASSARSLSSIQLISGIAIWGAIGSLAFLVIGAIVFSVAYGSPLAGERAAITAFGFLLGFVVIHRLTALRREVVVTRIGARVHAVDAKTSASHGTSLLRDTTAFDKWHAHHPDAFPSP